MAILNLEVLSGKSVLLQTNRNGDVEIIVSNLKTTTTDNRNRVTQEGGYIDNVIATIPYNRRKLVADFLTTH